MLDKLFNLFTGKRPNDVFDIIAMDIVLFYEALQKNYQNYFNKEYDLITTSGIINALKYINNESISLNDLKMAIVVARGGMCSLGLTEVPQEPNLVRTAFMGPENLLLNFIVQIEAMILDVLSNKRHNPQVIIHDVISRKKKIAKMIEITKKGIAVGKFSEEYQSALQLTDAFMTGEHFKEIREGLDFIKPPNSSIR